MTQTSTFFVYDPYGRRIYKQMPPGGQQSNNTCEVYFYGATGQKLESYSCVWPTNGNFGATLQGINTYFAGKMLSEKNVYIATDRLGSVRGNSNGETFSYFPWGEERGTGTADGRTKFAGYYRDAPGQDYAMARYYSANSGSFWSLDPGGIKTATPGDLTGWNRYAYAGSDPINFIDPGGRERCDPDDDMACFETDVYLISIDVDGGGDDDGGDDGGGGDLGAGTDTDTPQKHKHKGSKPNKPSDPCANTAAVGFIQTHLADATTLAASLNIPVAFIMAVSEAESSFGNSNITKNTHNFFGFHAGGSHSTGTYTTSGGAQVSSYLGLPDGYLASGQDFVGSESHASGVTDPTKFFTLIHDKYGIGTPDYVSHMEGVENMAATRIQDCIH